MTLGDHKDLPAGYGSWDDWNDPDNIAREEKLATDNKLEWKVRGPVPPEAGGPNLWNHMPFNKEKGHWCYDTREDLPAEYTAIEDWWSEEGLAREAEICYRLRIPWQLRGPPNGERFPGDTWRNRTWRAKSKKWMVRGGKKR